jgi:hypothetical protein
VITSGKHGVFQQAIPPEPSFLVEFQFSNFC